MPTESYRLEEVTPSITRLLHTERSVASRSSESLNEWRSAMEAGGWEIDLEHSPKARITLTINVPALPVLTQPPLDDAHKLPGSQVCAGAPAIKWKVPGPGDPVEMWAWDSGLYLPAPCLTFELGLTHDATYILFRAQLSAILGMSVHAQTDKGAGIIELVLEDPVPGPGKNGSKLSGWYSGFAWYGGWSLFSGTYRERTLNIVSWEDPGLYGENFWQFRVGISDGDYLPQLLSIWLDTSLTSSFRLRICVCPYQMAMWFDQLGDADFGSPTGFNRSLFVSMPWVPTGFTGHSAFAFVANNVLAVFRAHFNWFAWAWFDAGPWTPDAQWGAMIPLRRSRTLQTDFPDRLTTTQGLLLMDNAYVMSAKQPPTAFVLNNRIAGKLWNCAVVHERYDMSVVESQMEGTHWIHVSSHGFPPFGIVYGQQLGSVWWKVE